MADAERTFIGEVVVDVLSVFAMYKDGGSDPCVRIAAPWAWLATNTPDGPGTIAVRNTGPTEVEAHAWGDGAAYLLERVGGLCGFDDDTEINTMHPLVSSLTRRRPGLRMPQGHSVIHALVPRILGQKVTTVEAHRSWARIVWKFGATAPGPGEVRVPPTTDCLANLAYHELHALGVERRRAETIIRCAKRGKALEAAALRGPERLTKALESMTNVGPWTSSGVAQVCAADRDAVVTGDLHIPNTIAWNLAGEPKADDARMLELLEPFAGHRGLVQRLVKSAGGPPRTAPKAAIRRYERM